MCHPISKFLGVRAALLSCAVLAPLAAAAEPGPLLAGLLGEGWTSSVPTQASPTQEVFDNAQLSDGDVALLAPRLEVSVVAGENGRAAIQISAAEAVLRGVGPGEPLIDLETFTATFAVREAGAAPGCGLLDDLEVLRASSATLSFPEGTGFGLQRLGLDDLLVETAPDAEACRLEGVVESRALMAGSADLGAVTLGEVMLRLDLPASLEVARAAGETARVTLAAKEVAVAREDGASMTTGQAMEVSAEIDSRSLSPLFLLLAERDFMSANWNDAAAFMDSWNLASLLRADFRLDAETLQMMPPALVPPEWTANFAEVGLASVSWGLKAALRAREGTWSLGLEADMAGLGKLRGGAEVMSGLYDRAVLQAADEGGVAAVAPSPDLRMTGVDLTWRDSGLDRAFERIFGQTVASWADERILAGDVADAQRVEMAAEVSSTLRTSASGRPIRIRLTDASGLDLFNLAGFFPQDPMVVLGWMDWSTAQPQGE